MQRKALGRGLEALIPPVTAVLDAAPPAVRELTVEDISPNPFRPRTRFNDDAIQELAASMKATGILQPMLVRRTTGGDYQLVAGERRLRAARLAGLERVP